MLQVPVPKIQILTIKTSQSRYDSLETKQKSLYSVQGRRKHQKFGGGGGGGGIGFGGHFWNEKGT